MKRHPPGGPLAANGTPVGGSYRQYFVKHSRGGRNSGKVKSINSCTLEEGVRNEGKITMFVTHRGYTSLLLIRERAITVKWYCNRISQEWKGRRDGETSVSPARA